MTDISHVICVSLQLGQLLRGDNRHLELGIRIFSRSSSRNFKNRKKIAAQLVKEGPGEWIYNFSFHVPPLSQIANVESFSSWVVTGLSQKLGD